MSFAELLDALVSAAGQPLSTWPARYPQHRPLAVMCSYVPDEMLHAAGFTPVRVRAAGAPHRQAGTRLPSCTCTLCRSAIDQAMAGDLDGFTGTVFAHGCDTMQALADLWRMSAPQGHWVDTIMQPVNLGSAAARTYLVAELERFRSRLEEFSSRSIGQSALRTSIALHDETRRLVQTFVLHRAKLNATACLAVLGSAQAMPRSLYNRLLASLLSELEGAPPLASGPRLFLAGAVLDAPWLTGLIEELGAQVAGDDLCSGSRSFHGQVGSEGDPLANLADYYLQRPPCPAKRNPSHDPARHLLAQVQQTQSEAVLFVLQKYCEPHAFQYALLGPALEEAGVPHLMLELEHTQNLEGLRTRLQAFLEML